MAQPGNPKTKILVNTETSPISQRHPFWYATTGSQLLFNIYSTHHLTTISLTVSVHTISEPYIYKLVFKQQRYSPTILYCRKRDAIRKIKNEWWQYYSDCTNVQFIEHVEVDMGLLWDNSKEVFKSKSIDIKDITKVKTCHGYDSPRFLRRFSLPRLKKHKNKIKS